MFSFTNHEIYLICARFGERDNAMIASWILPATLASDKLRIVAVLSVHNLTVEWIRHTKRFALQMLAADQADLVPAFGLPSGRDVDKFAEIRVTQRTPAGLALLEGSCGWADCRVVSELDSGDRIIVLADVEAQQAQPKRRPLRKQEAFGQLSPDVAAKLREKQRRDGDRDAALVKVF